MLISKWTQTQSQLIFTLGNLLHFEIPEQLQGNVQTIAGEPHSSKDNLERISLVPPTSLALGTCKKWAGPGGLALWGKVGVFFVRFSVTLQCIKWRKIEVSVSTDYMKCMCFILQKAYWDESGESLFKRFCHSYFYIMVSEEIILQVDINVSNYVNVFYYKKLVSWDTWIVRMRRKLWIHMCKTVHYTEEKQMHFSIIR